MKTKIYKFSQAFKFLFAGSMIALICASAPTSGAYINDITQTQVNNPAQESLQTVNQILCVIKNTDFSEFIGKGTTLAQVDMNLCQTSGNPGQQSNGSNSSSTPDLLNVYFNAPTVNSGQPQTVTI